MILQRAAVVAAALAVVTVFFVKPAESSGIHEDFSRFFSFVTAPRAFAVDGNVALTDAPSNDASIFTATAALPYRTWIVVQPELSYVSKTTAEDIFNSAGDLRVRIRGRAWYGAGMGVFVIPGVRLGTGTADLFPYSTASIDVEMSVAVADTIGTSLGWLASASGVYPTRVSDALKSGRRYGNYATAAFGLMAMPGSRLVLKGGAAALFPADNPGREIYFADAHARYGAATTFYLSWQAEAREESNRAINYSVSFGARLTF